MSANTLFSIGNIIKKESLISIDFQNECKSLVLESNQPYPGYHGVTLPKSKPDSLYLVTKTRYSDEKIIRAIQKIKKESSITFDAAPGSIELNNLHEADIRIKRATYEQVPQLLDRFIYHGIEFAKYRKVNNYQSLISIRKYFKIEEIAENIFHDWENNTFYYLTIPFLPEWVAFEEMTKQIKYNIEENNFDAALCSMYNQEGLIDFVRIYDEKFSMDKMMFIRQKYLNTLAKI